MDETKTAQGAEPERRECRTGVEPGGANDTQQPPKRPFNTRTLLAPHAIPEDLKGFDHWVTWKYHYPSPNAKPDKIPCDPRTLRFLRRWQEDPATWHTFDDAIALYETNPKLAGIGFVLTPDLGIVGVDMDHAIDLDTGEIAEWAREHVSDLDTYTEVSPSGAGLRAFIYGTLPEGAPKKCGNRELYDRSRWLTVTSNVLNDSPIASNRDAAIGRYLAHMQRSNGATGTAEGPVAGTANTELMRAILAGADLHESTCALAFRLIDDGMQGAKATALLRALYEAMPNRGDPARWEARFGDIPRLVRDAEAKKRRDAAISRGTDSVPREDRVSDFVPETEMPPRKLLAVELGDLMDAPRPAPTCAVFPIVPDGIVTLFGGHGGVGKNHFVEVLAVHIAAGVAEWAGLRLRAGRVVIVSLEDPPDVLRWRLAAICRAYKLAFDPANLVILDGTQSEAALAVEVSHNGVRSIMATAVMDELAEAAEGATLVIVDGASDAFDGDENSRREVRAFMRALSRIATANRCGLILLAHIDKLAARTGSAGQSYSGSTAWHNSSRSRIALVATDGAVELRHERGSYGPRIDPIRVRFDEHGVMFPCGAADVGNRDDDALLDCLAYAINRGEIVSTSRTGPGNAHAVARTFAGFPPGLESADRFWLSLGRLAATGRLAREKYLNEQRKPREKWTIAQIAQVCAGSTTSATRAGTEAPAQVLAGGMGGEPAQPKPERPR